MARVHLDSYGSDFEATLARSVGAQCASVERLRREAIRRFGEMGFPSTRLEDWRFTNVDPIAQKRFRLASENASDSTDAAAAIERGVGGAGWPTRLVFVDGCYSKVLSRTATLPAGSVVGSLRSAVGINGINGREHVERVLGSTADAKQHAFVALNTAFIEDGAYVRIPDGEVVADPICLVYVSTGRDATVSHPRNLLTLGAGSQATVVECYVAANDGNYLTNSVTEISIGANASLDHYRLQAESESAFHVATVAARLASHGRFASHSVSLGGALVRNDVTAVLDGVGAECLLNGLYRVGGRQHVDNHTTIDHAAPRSSSEETYKGVLDGHARAVFSGRVIVRKDAQKITARQTNKNLLLSEEAAVNTKPQLEIRADDVKCAHGATVGMLDADALFYLRSRGLDAEAARQLLVYAFAREVLDSIKVKPLLDTLVGGMLAELPGGGSLGEAA